LTSNEARIRPICAALIPTGSAKHRASDRWVQCESTSGGASVTVATINN
jgi:hypothetical protein